ncbi:YhhA family cyclophane-containing RiPP [Caulobacter soli]|uniref:YhhA family cyclophane-containing RiPP n=1 Tax=Caulobacter soli TaxID=2708539 RepID=UPI0013EBA81E|nr:YhhA family cyclophane-containing RiPP [Caulobacter soli]
MNAAPARPVEPTAATGSLKLDSAALQRLMQEVRNNAVSTPSAYNRMHNRHNR